MIRKWLKEGFIEVFSTRRQSVKLWTARKLKEVVLLATSYWPSSLKTAVTLGNSFDFISFNQNCRNQHEKTRSLTILPVVVNMRTESPRSLCDHPLTKGPVDSGYEITLLVIKPSQPRKHCCVTLFPQCFRVARAGNNCCVMMCTEHPSVLNTNHECWQIITS